MLYTFFPDHREKKGFLRKSLLIFLSIVLFYFGVPPEIPEILSEFPRVSLMMSPGLLLEISSETSVTEFFVTSSKRNL